VIVVIIDKREHGFYVTMLISRRTAEQSEDRTWRTSAPKLDPWYMFPIESSSTGRTPEHAFDLYNGDMPTLST